MRGVWHVLTRRKVLDETTDLLKPSKLARRLNTFDLVALGVGSTLGVGVYVLAGHVARDAAGPSVILSFLIAAIASLFAGLCYAEFGARVPRAGSAYVYSYVCVGEFVAFIIGWNLILEYVIGAASVSRGISLYLDTLLNDTLKTTFREIAPINISFMSDYFDLLAFGLAFLLGVVLAFGLKESAIINNIFTVLNILIIVFVIIIGSMKADVSNWNITPNETNSGFNVGAGGFFPFGFSGTLKGAATCFFGFVGFDCIATTGEEVHNPKRAIPLSIIISLGTIFLAYFGISTVLTLMWPYYLQDANAPIPFVFGEVGWEWAKWTVAIGGIFGLIASLFGSLFPLPRILYAMATDGLVFKFFGDVSTRFHTPVFGTILATSLTGIMAGLFELSHLVNMMSIGTLMAYTIVAASVLLLRYNNMYEPFDKRQLECLLEDSDETYSLLDSAYYDEDYEETLYSMNQVFESDTTMSMLKGDIIVHETSYLMNQNEKITFGKIIKQLCDCTRSTHPNKHSSIIVGSLITFYCLLCVAFGLCLMYLSDELVLETTWAIILTCLFGFLMVLCVILIFLQPRSKTELSFQVPCVPLVPCISIFINIYLMLMLDTTTWIRFGIWMAVGIPIYLTSLCVYERGGNFLTHAQKTSITTNTANGKLNYAFENTAECQERATSFVPDFVESRQPVVVSAGYISEKPERKNVERFVQRDNVYNVNVRPNGFTQDNKSNLNKARDDVVVVSNNKNDNTNGNDDDSDKIMQKINANFYYHSSSNSTYRLSPEIDYDDISNHEDIKLEENFSHNARVTEYVNNVKVSNAEIINNDETIVQIETDTSYDDSNEMEDEIANFRIDLHQNGQIFNIADRNNEEKVTSFIISDSENVTSIEIDPDDDKITNYEEIELLDKVIKDEEDAAGMSPVLDRTEIEIHPVPKISPESSPNSPRVSSTGDGVNQPVSSEHSVVALVHREDTLTNDLVRATSVSNVLDENAVSAYNKNFHIQIEEEIKKDIAGETDTKDKEKFVPPPAPPLDMSFFNNTSPIVRFKVVKYEKDDEKPAAKKESKSAPKTHRVFIPLKGNEDDKHDESNSEDDKHESEEEDDDDNNESKEGLKFGTRRQHLFMNKLESILSKSKRRPSIRKNVQSMNDDFVDNEQSNSEREKYKSEPNLVAALRNERIEMIKNYRASENIPPDHIYNKSPNNEARSSDSDDNEQGNVTEDGNAKTMSKDNIKKRLEALFSSTQSAVPPTVRRKNWNKAYESNDTEPENITKSTEELNAQMIKPKKKEHYTNTMKLQRARFGDVLKSIERKNRRDSILSPDYNPSVSKNISNEEDI